MDYDPRTGPDPEAWLALEPAARVAAVAAWYEAPGVGLPPAHGPLTAPLHAHVETQIAAGEPVVVRETLERLQADGLRRQAALFAVVEVFVRHMAALATESYDEAVYIADLHAIDASEFVATDIKRRLGSEE